jgi:hypothetical protein
MQYYIKFFNVEKNEFLGYYKESGIGCITKLPKGTKYFNTIEEALMVMTTHDNSFVRDSDGHYYTGSAIIYGDATRTPTKDIYRRSISEEEERKNEIEAFIRKNHSNY